MFAKGSRYRNIDQSSALNASGEYLAGTELRLIPDTAGQFQHTVRDRDRLDLLAYKYYSDATRWWQICDANPQYAFPNDLLDRTPLTDISLVLIHPDVAARYASLLSALSALGQVTAPAAGLPGDFVSCAVVVVYALPTARPQILNQITANGFHLVRWFAWQQGAVIGEQFLIEDLTVKAAWQDMMHALRGMPGLSGLIGDMGTSAVQLTFNTAILTLASIYTNVAQYGFDVPATLAQILDRTGSKIPVPPNGVA